MNGIVVGIHAIITNLSYANSLSESTKLLRRSLPMAEDHEYVFKENELYNGFINIEFQNLTASYIYKVEMRYFTAIGYGPWSPSYELVTSENSKHYVKKTLIINNYNQ